MSAIEEHARKRVQMRMMLWDGTPKRADEIRRWVGDDRFCTPDQLSGVNEHAQLWVGHNQAWVPLPVGQRVVQEIDGSGFYPLSPDGFEAGYETVAPASPELAEALTEMTMLARVHEYDIEIESRRHGVYVVTLLDPGRDPIWARSGQSLIELFNLAIKQLMAPGE